MKEKIIWGDIMMSLEDLLSGPETVDYLQRNEEQGKSIQRAAEQLKCKPDGKAALLSLFDALKANKIFVFFSYKNKDREAATAIVTKLRKWSADKLDISYMDDFKGDPGQDYSVKIHAEIARANWFILLFSDPTDDWDWSLYEAGLFDRNKTSAHRLICLHHTNVDPPSPIVDYQSVSAEQDAMEEFLRMVFIKENPIPGMEPVNKALADEIPSMASEIIETIRNPVQTYKEIYEPWIELSIEQPKDLETPDQLDKAIVISANQKAMALFGLLEPKNTWGEFRENIVVHPGMENQWLLELTHVVRKIANGHVYKPIQAVFQSCDGKMHRPVVCAVERDGKRGPIRTFHLTFVEDVSTVDRSAMPHELSLLANLLRSTFRFRYEILEKFCGKSLNDNDIECIANALSRIEQDWESRNLSGPEEIMELFPVGEGGDRLKEMMRSWRKARNQVKTGSLDIALMEKDATTISRILENFQTQNQDFLEMAAERFSKLISGK